MILFRSSEHEPLGDAAWDAEAALRGIAAIVADAEGALRPDGLWPPHPRDEWDDDAPPPTTLYLGAAGMIWALHALGSRLDLPELASAALDRYRAAPDFAPDANPASLWMGETGLLLVAALVGSEAADPERLRMLVHANREHPTWEAMWGSPGTMLAARAAGFDDLWRESAELLWERWDDETDLWTQALYGNVVQVLGPAHGLAGNVHALRGLDDDALRARTARALGRTALREDGLANWPTTAETPALESRIRVQWCHGAPGIVATVGDLLPLELATAGGELTWRAGPLAKGPSLCHGTAGNGFAFLKLHALTGDELWLDRARRFAMHALAQVEAEHARAGRGRYTLFTGDVGAALLARACLDGDPRFPTVDVR